MQLISNAALTLSSYLTVSVLQPPSWGKPAVFKKNSDTTRAPYLQETMTDSLQHQRFNLLSVWCKSFRDTSRGISKLQSLQPEVQIQIHEWSHMCSTEIHSSDRVQLNTHTHSLTHTIAHIQRLAAPIDFSYRSTFYMRLWKACTIEGSKGIIISWKTCGLYLRQNMYLMYF